MMSRHGVFLVPVRVDLDGTLLVVCPGVDEDLDVHYWAGWCAECGTVVTDQPIPGTVGVQDIDGLPDDEYDLVEEWEHNLSRAHVAQHEQVTIEQERSTGILVG